MTEPVEEEHEHVRTDGEISVDDAIGSSTDPTPGNSGSPAV